MWTSLGAGGVARRLIGTVTIVGMAFSTAFAIFLIPVLFVVIERMSRGRRGRAAEVTPSAEPPARPAAPHAVPARERVS
jgi:apolipoprotein N-acyltransferase